MLGLRRADPPLEEEMGEGEIENLCPLFCVSQGHCLALYLDVILQPQWNLISAYSEPVSLDSWVSHGLRPGKLRVA